MARPKNTATAVYSKADSPFWKANGLAVTDKEVSFKASVGEGAAKVEFPLKATVKQIAFGGNMQTAVAAFGSVENVLTALQKFINEDLMTSAKTKVKADSLGFEKKVADSTSAAIAKFTETRKTAPTAEQVTAIRGKVRARLEELARLEKETVDLAGI